MRKTGHLIAIGRVESLSAGELLSSAGTPTMAEDWPPPPPGTYGVAFHVENNQDSGLNQLTLRGQGEQHAAIALDRLKNRFCVGDCGPHRQHPTSESPRHPRASILASGANRADTGSSAMCIF